MIYTEMSMKEFDIKRHGSSTITGRPIVTIIKRQKNEAQLINLQSVEPVEIPNTQPIEECNRADISILEASLCQTHSEIVHVVAENFNNIPAKQNEDQREEPIKITVTEANSNPVTQVPGNINVDLEVANSIDVILQQENEQKKAERIEIRSTTFTKSDQAIEVPVSKIKSTLLPTDQINAERQTSAHTQPNLSLSALLDTSFKDNPLLLPKTPGSNAKFSIPNFTTS